MTLERPLVEKRTDDEVPHIISERTHQSLSKKPTAFGNRLFQQYPPEADIVEHFVPAGGTWIGPPPMRARGPIWRNLRPMRTARAPPGECPGRLGLALRGKQLAPAARADVALNEFARVRRLEIDAAVAVLIALRRTLIFGVPLADLLLRCRLRDRRSDCRRAECKGGAGECHTA